MKIKYSIGLDLGTSSVKAVLFDGKDVVKTDSAKFDITLKRYEDGSSYKGFSADDYAQAVFGVIKNLAKEVNGNVCGISMASASGNTLITDENGKPLTGIYSWTNDAFLNECEKVYGVIDSDESAKISGWKFFGTFPLSHLAHVKVHAPDVYKKLKTVCMSTEYLQFLMTGKWGIDRSSAVPFYLLEQTTGKWHAPYLKALNITEDNLPKVYGSGDFLGEITDEFSEKYGVNKGCKIYLGSFDHPSGAVANSVVNEGDLLLSCGTSWVCFFPSRDREKILKNNLLCDTFLSYKNGTWGAMSSVAKVSYEIDKILNRVFDEEDKLKAFNEYSERAKRGADGLKINPTKDSEKDFSSYKKENVARALMEGAADLLKENLDRLENAGFKFNDVKMAGGPSKSKIWREIIEYTLNKKVTVTYGVNSGAVGSAIRAYK